MNKKEFKICIIYCYIGKFPWYFPFFLKSCEYNPTIDFIIVTDQPKLENCANNIKFIKMDLHEVNTLANEQLGFQTNISYAYKLCDFKPTFGVIFSELLAVYDFWGFGDIDVIFGNIRGFYTTELLSEYDVISSRPDYLTGCLCLFKNNFLINRLYEESKDYRLVLQSEKYYGFDECNFQFQRLKEGKSILENNSEIEGLTYVVKKLEAVGKIKVFFDQMIIEDVPGNLEWKAGSLFYKNKFEALLYHLIIFKDHTYLQLPDWKEIPDNYFINEFFFSEYSPTSEEGKELIEQHNKKRADAVFRKVASYNSETPLNIPKKLLEVDSTLCGTYQPLCPSDIVTVSIGITIVNDQIFFVFPDNTKTGLQYFGDNIFLLTTPLYKAELSFFYDQTQLRQALTFLPIGDHLRKEFHKVDN